MTESDNDIFALFSKLPEYDQAQAKTLIAICTATHNPKPDLELAWHALSHFKLTSVLDFIHHVVQEHNRTGIDFEDVVAFLTKGLLEKHKEANLLVKTHLTRLVEAEERTEVENKVAEDEKGA